MSSNNHTHKVRDRDRRAYRRVQNDINDEIEIVKSKLRTAYALNIRLKEGEELTPEEMEILEEQVVNQKVLARLEEVRERIANRIGPRVPHLSHAHGLAIIKFFYLVRLAQQGFFYLVSAIYPALEPQAIAYVADKLVGTTLHHDNSHNVTDRINLRATLIETADKLFYAVDEPVGEGFRTTYKQIMEAVHRLSYQGIVEREKEEEEEKVDVETVREKPQRTSMPQTMMPPIWVVMPYTSMMDGSTFAVPGTQPSLPFPMNMIPSGIMPQFPVQEPYKRRSNYKKKKSKRKTDDEKSVQNNDEKDTETAEGQSLATNEVKEAEEQSDDNELDFDDDDRFADPESSDEESVSDDDNNDELKETKDSTEAEQTHVEETKSEVTEEKETSEKAAEESNKSTGEACPTPTDKDVPETKDGDTAKTGWISFAESNKQDVDAELLSRLSSSRSSPRLDRNHGYKY